MVEVLLREGKFVFPSIVGLTVCALILTWLAPEEKTLGNLVKLVYVHAATTWVALIMYTLAGLIGLGYLVWRQNSFYQWSSAIEKTAILFWIGQIALGLLAMRFIWGGFYWGEPRVILAWAILLVSVSSYVISTISEKPAVISLLNFGVALTLWILIIKLANVLHPGKAILGSPETNIKLFTGLIALFFLGAAAQLTRYILLSQPEL